MAHILDEDFIAKSYTSALGKADFWRQRDVYVLAQRGDRQCQRLWRDFASEQPGMARLVVADVEHDRQEANKAAAFVDDVLVKAEKPKVAEAAKRAATAAVSREAAVRAAIVADLASADPGVREVARDILRRGLA